MSATARLRGLLHELADVLADHVEAPRQPAQPEEKLLPLRQTGLSPRTLRAAIAAGSLPAVRVGRDLLVRRSDVDAWLERRRVAPKERGRSAPEPSTPATRAIQQARAQGRLRVLGAGR